MTAASKNELLALLPPSELQELNRHLRRVPLSYGAVVHEAGNPIDRVYFPESAVFSLVVGLTGGELIESATVGWDGAVGGFAALHHRAALGRAVVQVEGTALVIGVDRLREICTHSSSLYRLLGFYNQFLYAQAQQTAACNAAHSLEARLCRRLLRMHELCGRKFVLTQDALAEFLGVRRTSVSLTAHSLQISKIIAYRRGAIEILDPDRLQQTSCECHGALRAQRIRLFEAPAEAGGHIAGGLRTDLPVAPA
jgi:CRP-like cAMP-binding protein